MGPGMNRTRDPWICSQTRICCQKRYRLRYADQYQVLKKIVNWLPLTKTNREYFMLGNIRFIAIFYKFILPNQVDLSVHCSYHFATTNNLRLRDFPMEIPVINFKLGQIWWKPSFPRFLLTIKTHFDMSFTFLVVTCLDYHFVQSDLVGSGFLRPKLWDFRSNL